MTKKEKVAMYAIMVFGTFCGVISFIMPTGDIIKAFNEKNATGAE